MGAGVEWRVPATHRAGDGSIWQWNPLVLCLHERGNALALLGGVETFSSALGCSTRRSERGAHGRVPVEGQP